MTKIVVNKLIGYKSLAALNVFNTLLLGLKMLPIYGDVDYVTFAESFKTKSDDEKESSLRQACSFVTLTEDEINTVASFCNDPNGVPYSKENIKNLSVKDIHEIVVAVCMEVGRIEINLLSEAEKKKLQISPST